MPLTPTAGGSSGKEWFATPKDMQAFARDRLVLQEPTGVTPQALSWVRASWSKVLIASVTPFIDVYPFGKLRWSVGKVNVTGQA